MYGKQFPEKVFRASFHFFARPFVVVVVFEVLPSYKRNIATTNLVCIVDMFIIRFLSDHFLVLLVEWWQSV